MLSKIFPSLFCYCVSLFGSLQQVPLLSGFGSISAVSGFGGKVVHFAIFGMRTVEIVHVVLITHHAVHWSSHDLLVLATTAH